MPSPSRIFGDWGEQIAVDFLISVGFEIKVRNYKTKQGEIDLIVAGEGMIIAVEVKTRSNHQFGYPEEAITPKKLATIYGVFHTWLSENQLLDQPTRIDAIAITLTDPDPITNIIPQPNILHLKGV